VRRVLMCLVLMSLCAGCSDRKNMSPMPSISDDSRQALARPVNCSTASRDIAVLEDERASVGKQILSGVRTVLPVAAVAGILMGDYGDRLEVTTGKYNRDLEAKIQHIKGTCGVS
jgi:hypothetical protein